MSLTISRRSNINSLVPLLRLEYINTKALLELPKTHPLIASYVGFESMMINALKTQVNNSTLSLILLAMVNHFLGGKGRCAGIKEEKTVRESSK